MFINNQVQGFFTHTYNVIAQISTSMASGVHAEEGADGATAPSIYPGASKGPVFVKQCR